MEFFSTRQSVQLHQRWAQQQPFFFFNSALWIWREPRSSRWSSWSSASFATVLKARSTLWAFLADVSKCGMFSWSLHQFSACFSETCRESHWTKLNSSPQSTYRSVFQVDFVTQNYKWKVLSVSWARLDQEFISPVLKIFERFHVCRVVHKDTAVSSTIECVSQGMEALLSGSVPNLPVQDDLTKKFLA